MLISEINFGEDKILIAEVPDCKVWTKDLLEEFSNNQDKLEHSHKINQRWENSYLNIDCVPSVRVPMRFCRDMGLEILKINSVILFESLPGNANPHPPFWFNVAKPNECTGLHDHAFHSVLSAVTYLSLEKGCGNLYFQKDEEIEIEPEVGMIVIFPPHFKHGVRPNKSSKDLSLIHI